MNFGHNSSFLSLSLCLFSFDVRDKASSTPKHWSAPEVFGPRANFVLDKPESLVIQVSGFDLLITEASIEMRLQLAQTVWVPG